MMSRTVFRSASTLSVANRVATVSLSNPPVNLLSRDVLKSLKEHFDSIPRESDIDGIVLTSARDGIFTGGLDIFELYDKSDESLRAYWTMLQEMWISLYTCPLPVVGALNGPSPAAGCLLALACDYRIKADNPKFVTGLNETMLGFAAPNWLAKTFVDVVGHRQAYQALLLSNLYTPNDALKIGLVDQVCPVDKLNTEADKFIREMAKIPLSGRVKTKLIMRQELADWLRQNQQDDATKFIEQVLNEQTQKDIGNYIQKMKKR